MVLQENIGLVFEEQGKLEEAEQMYNETLQIRLKVFGEDSLQVAHTRKNIADIRKKNARLTTTQGPLMRVLVQSQLERTGG